MLCFEQNYKKKVQLESMEGSFMAYDKRCFNLIFYFFSAE